MTNAEKYLRDGVDVEEVKNSYLTFLSHYYDDSAFEDWLETEYEEQAKPQLTEDERVILRNVDKKRYQKIERDRETLWIHGVDKDGASCAEEFTCYEHLFNFIKERRRI